MKQSRQKPFFAATIIFLLTISLIILFMLRADRQALTAENGNVMSPKDIERLLSTGAFLRDSQVLPNGHGLLLLYVEPGYTTGNWDYITCPGMILGHSIKGKYHLARVEAGKITQDILLSASPYSSEDKSSTSLELAYKNIKGNLENLPYNLPEANTVETVKLLNLKDLNGDSKAEEVLFVTTGGGCGFYDGMVAGYNEKEKKIVLLSSWEPRFNPKSDGTFHYLFMCGDHGNDTQVERDYQFDWSTYRFKEISQKETPCPIPTPS